jgi:oxygen-independent coproporphyrinogen-3 oxidase
MGLRLSEGIDLDRLAAISGLMPEATAVQRLVDLALLERAGECRLRTAPAGRLVLDKVVLELAAALQPTLASASATGN